ncbi:bacterioferritin comigratory protein [Candidatus Protochlamydia naegleriophila]|uniref:thioredoxin-dependent peroxiredoxin n=1 Tax=Candidatus Protochlamydia naegleriophila TaxID=389348 RepID=A0A0U5K0T9_9BACT|nr:peroxiredoxin [Candidatus Protochlamydia naegleriophila]CUI15723.1 bacterioferritin comigratory protein [Candidatus Protochlamydia naegleriophila]
MALLSVGSEVPSFEATTANGQALSNKQLLDQVYIFYFYPKDDTPGCTAQACSFRDAKPLFDAGQVRVIGVSPDSAASHARFTSKYGLNYTLLPDPTHHLCELFGVWQEKVVFGKKRMGVVRTTFIVDAQGIIRWIESPVRVEGHAERVLEALQSPSFRNPS